MRGRTDDAASWPALSGDMAARVRALDWSATSLGPASDWPAGVRAVVELALASPMVATMALGPERRLIYNDAAARLYGERHPAVLGQPLASAFPDSYPAVAPFYDRVFAGESVVARAQPLTLARGGEVFDAYLTPVRGADGAVAAAHMIGLEIGDRLRAERELRESEARLAVLVAELQHRVRNMLTVVRSVFARTMEMGGDVAEVADHFTGRLDALARTQVAVTQSEGGLVDLENLIRDELLSVGAADGPQLTIAGPEVLLTSNEAELIGLALHELTTNALKYGALKGSTARLDIAWTANIGYVGGRRLDLSWAEQGVPAITIKPTRHGFGSELIEEALPYRLGAETKLQFRGGGVLCTISVPLSDQRVPAED